jgi:hypothetical protein
MRKRLLVLMGLAFLASLVLAGCQGRELSEQEKKQRQIVKEFGIKKSKPINQGFFFYEGKYIDAPYIVERRGLDVYINDIRVRKGPEWPPYDYAVEQDPGEPPPGSSPFDPPPPGVDPRDNYWSNKWGYLRTHYDLKTAQDKMIDTYRKCPDFVEVRWEEEGSLVALIDESGKKHFIDLRPPTRRLKPPSVAIFRFEKGGELGFSGEDAVKALEILLSEATADEKVRAFEEMTSKPGLLWFQQMVTGFKANPQLADRLKALKESLPKN